MSTRPETAPVPARPPAVVTGASRGIGLECARALAAAGHPVVLTARSAGALAAARDTLIAGGARAIAFPADVADPEQVEALFRMAEATFGPPLVLVNNAGAADSAPFLKTPLALVERLWRVNLLSAWVCTQRALPAMLARRWGRVIQVASTAAVRGHPYVSAYCASKHAVLGMTRSLALEVATRGVTVNAVCPGYVDTAMFDQTVSTIVSRTGRDAADARKAIEGLNPQGRILEASEVAALVAFLATDEARGIHGQALGLDGGATA